MKRITFLVIWITQRYYFINGEYLLTSCPPELIFKEGSDSNQIPVVEETTVRLGHFTELRCCAPSSDKISWYKERHGSWQPFEPLPPQFNPIAPMLTENGQILVIKSASKSDEGNYKCVLEKDGKEIDKRRMKLTVAECDELARGPYPIAPLPCGNTPVSLDTSVTLPCTGYFGCGDELRTVTWFVTDISGAPNWREASGVSSRYKIRYSQRNGNSELGANLTISNIDTIDLDRKFMCVLSTPQIIQGESKVIVQLTDRQQISKELTVDSASITTAVVVSVGAIVLTLLFVLLLFVILIRYRRRMKQRHCHQTIKVEQEHMLNMSKMATNV